MPTIIGRTSAPADPGSRSRSRAGPNGPGTRRCPPAVRPGRRPGSGIAVARIPVSGAAATMLEPDNKSRPSERTTVARPPAPPAAGFLPLHLGSAAPFSIHSRMFRTNSSWVNGGLVRPSPGFQPPRTSLSSLTCWSNLLQGFVPVLIRIFQLAGELARGFALKDHLHFGRRQVPVRVSRRHVRAGQVGELVTIRAFQCVLSLAVRTALDVLGVHMAVVALERRVAGRVAIQASRVHQDLVCLLEGGA